MKVFEKIVGQSKAIGILNNASSAARNNKGTQEMTHAWLFTGPPGSGRSNLALAFGASLICSQGGCGDCTDCQTALVGSHPDVEVFSTEGISIKVDDIRELVSRSSWAASLSAWRVVIVEDCDRMTESAANALLKAVEEPALQTVWLLSAPTPEDVLPTIRSRCRIISLATPTTREVSEYLINELGASIEEAKVASAISQGHIGRARHYVINKETMQLRKRVMELFLSITSEASAIINSAQLLEIATSRAEIMSEESGRRAEELLRATVQGPNRGLLSGGSKVMKDFEKSQKSRTSRLIRDELDIYFLWFQSLIRDSLLLATRGSGNLVNPDLSPQLTQLKERFSSTELESIGQRISRYRETLDSNAAQLLSLEAFFLEFQGPRSGQKHSLT